MIVCGCSVLFRTLLRLLVVFSSKTRSLAAHYSIFSPCKVLYCVPPSHSPDSLPSLWLSPFLGRFSARGCSSAVTRAFLKYAFRSLFVIDDVSGSGAVDGAGTGSVSVAVLSVSCAPGTRNLWPPVPSARARARASERRL